MRVSRAVADSSRRVARLQRLERLSEASSLNELRLPLLGYALLQNKVSTTPFALWRQGGMGRGEGGREERRMGWG